jgi:radical SAM superfamily enzyme YgiQ (UPF0313 family)
MSSQRITPQRNILFIILPYLVKQGDAKNSKIRSFTAFPYGVLSVVAYLKNHVSRKVNIKIIDCNLYSYDESIRIIKKNLMDFKPDIVGLSMMFDNSYKHLRDISRIIKENNNNTIVVLGGTAASLSYDIIINEQDYIDGICYSEGEIPFAKLTNSEDITDFLENDESWITKKSIKQGKSPQKSFITDLNEVINIDYILVDIENYSMKEAFSPFISDSHENKKQFFLVTSRGCPYKCVFCSTSSTLYGNIIRYASVDNIIAHVKHLVMNYGMNVLTIYDDQLLSNKERAKEIFRQLSQFNLRIECPNGLSVVFIDDEMAALMKKAGMDTVALAIESGSNYMLKKIIHKPLKLEMVKPVVQILRKQGFFIEGFFVIGIPGEKEEHRLETLNFIKDVELDWCGFSLATPLRGSELYDICMKNGYIRKDLKIGEIEDKKYIIKTPDLDPEDITKKTYLMNLDVNFVNNYRMKIGDYKVAANCFQDVIKRYSNHAFAYYYLVKAQESMHENPERIKVNKNKFYEIIEKDSAWKEYVEYYNLNLK